MYNPFKQKNMALAVVKQAPTSGNVAEFLNKIENQQQREDSFWILEYMKQLTKQEPVLWGPSLIGFGELIVKSPASGREVKWFTIGFSPRKANLSLYVNGAILVDEARMKTLGKHKTGKGCLYINKLADVDLEVLKSILNDSLRKGDS